MAKKSFGKIITLAAIAGAAAAGVSYLLQYKSFHKGLDEEFHDFEDEFDEFDDEKEAESQTVRTYVSLNPERQAETAPEAEMKTELKTESSSDTIEEVLEEMTENVVEIDNESALASTTIVEDTTE